MRRAELEYERTSDRAITYLRVSGVIDERFEGSRAGSRIKSESVIVNCAAVQLITSFGIRRWGEFVDDLGRRKIALYYVECSPRFVDELNQVVHFAAHGHVLSTYAPYTCSTCRAQRTILIRVDTDAETIRTRQPPTMSCMVCGGTLEFDDDPAAYFPALAPHVGVKISPQVLTFLEARLGYTSDNERNLQIQKVISGDHTVIMMAGTLDASLRAKKLSEGLEGPTVLDLSSVLHVQQPGLRAWREFLDEAMRRAAHLWLIGCPALIAERAMEGLGGATNLDVVSVRIPYHCEKCGATEFVPIELEGKDGSAVRQGQFPRYNCSGCGKTTDPMVGAKLVQELQQMRPPSAPGSLRKAVKKAQRQIEASRKVVAPKKSVASNWWAIAAISAVVVLTGFSSVLFLRERNEKPAPNSDGTNQTFMRPDWVSSDLAASSYCVDRGLQLTCVGISAYRDVRDEAEQEAMAGALEAVLRTTLLTGDSPGLSEQRDKYLQGWTEAVQNLEKAHDDEKNPQEHEAALGAMLTLRGRVADLALRQRSPGTPIQRTDWYWEQYNKEPGPGTEFLVWVRIDVSSAEAKAAIANYYGGVIEVDAGKVVPAAPGIGWLVDPAGKIAFYVVNVDGGLLAQCGIEPGDILLIEGQAEGAEATRQLITAALEKGQPNVEVRRGNRFETIHKPTCQQ